MKFNELDLMKVGHEIVLAGGVYVGLGQTLICPFPEDLEEVSAQPAKTVEMDVEAWLAFLRQADLLETEVLAKAKNGHLTKTILRKSQRQIDQQISWAVFRRAGYACEYCGADDVPLTVDHLVTWEEGGPMTPENLLCACRKCNRIRGNTPFDVWLRHPHYLRVARNLSPEAREEHKRRARSLAAIPRRIHIQSR